MSDKIDLKLESSDVAKSLRMEQNIYRIILSLGWNATHSAYYKDLETGKLREIDVHSYQPLEGPVRRRRIGSPLITMQLFCECKSLAGHNILFSDSFRDDYAKINSMSEWIGRDKVIKDISLKIMKMNNNSDAEQLQKLYKYILDRAYPNEGRALAKYVDMTGPPIDMHTTSFRETKGGKIDAKGNLEAADSSPLWNAIRSNLSAVAAARKRSRDTCMSFINGQDPRFDGPEGYADQTAFFIDTELLRFFYFHPVVFIDLRLWAMRENEISEIYSARVYIKDLSHKHLYVDVVSNKHANDYLASTINGFNKSSRKSFRQLWRMIDSLGWHDRKGSPALQKILGLHQNEGGTELC